MRFSSLHRWLPALTVAALALQAPTVFSESRTQIPLQMLAVNAPQSPGTAPTPATTPRQTPEFAGQSQPAAAVALASSTPPTQEEIADALMAEQRYQAAIEAYKMIPRLSAEDWNKLGIAYQLMFNLVDASRAYHTSLKLSGKNPQVLNNLGTIYDAQKEYGDAERLYHKALKIDPHSALIYKNLGTNLLAQHKYQQGWGAYQAALKIDPNVFKNLSGPRVQNASTVEERGATNYYMARGCVRAGMNDCAIEYLRMALNEGFTNPKKIQADSEFAGLRGVPAFQQLLAEQQQQ
jgi:Flp pilus assembly protein TadD